MVEAFDIQLFNFKSKKDKDLYEKILDTSIIVDKENSGVGDIFLDLIKINNIDSKSYKLFQMHVTPHYYRVTGVFEIKSYNGCIIDKVKLLGEYKC